METIMTFLRVYTGKSDETENGKKRSFGRWRREMFREIRKKKNAITADAAESLLEKSRRGVLAVNGDDGYPYAIPVNYFYDRNEQKIYFHGARRTQGRCAAGFGQGMLHGLRKSKNVPAESRPRIYGMRDRSIGQNLLAEFLLKKLAAPPTGEQYRQF